MHDLMYGLPRQAVPQLQRLQHSAVRHITQNRKFDHTSLLRQLHWYSVAQRIISKISTLTCRALHGLALNYITDVLKPYVPARTFTFCRRKLADRTSLKTEIMW